MNKFYKILLEEFVCLPFLYLFHFIKARTRFQNKIKLRSPIEHPQINIFIHEWGGYEPIREKAVPRVKKFECGLLSQLERFSNQKCNIPIRKIVTISDMDRMSADRIGLIESYGAELIAVSNIGMDFSGYKTAFERMNKNQSNSYVILTNSSVNSRQTEFLQGYIDYMEKNPDVGILGISYNTKCYCSLIRNNFMPHLQSFFLLTTVDVLNEIVAANHGKFPGCDTDHKYTLIRTGEIAISSIALNQGYALACVLETGEVFKFRKGTPLKKFPSRDYRISSSLPNGISPIKNPL